MKYGVADWGMNVYEGGLFDLEERLATLKKIGFNGLERLEACETMGAVRNASIFHRMGMDFATARGTKLEQNLEWSSAFGKEYVWLTPGETGRGKVSLDVFIRRARKFVEACRKYNLKAALHNHLGQVVERQEELDRFMEECPGAYLLLDIGHLACAGGDVCGTLERYYDRLAAIHFKDAFIKDESIGLDRWFERLRFCELGGGNKEGLVDWKGAAEILRKKHYDKWVLVEHDTHLNEPAQDLAVSLERLKNILE